MGGVFNCKHCGKERLANPRLKGTQRYCGDGPCQRARKSTSRKERLAADPTLRDMQRQSQRDWLAKTRDYWRDYRQRNPEKAERNRLLQGLRRRSYRRRQGRVPDGVAKIDTFLGLGIQGDGEYWLVPRVAKIDAFLAKITIITSDYPALQR
jgi:hypothetical protein